LLNLIQIKSFFTLFIVCYTSITLFSLNINPFSKQTMDTIQYQFKTQINKKLTDTIEYKKLSSFTFTCTWTNIWI